MEYSISKQANSSYDVHLFYLFALLLFILFLHFFRFALCSHSHFVLAWVSPIAQSSVDVPTLIEGCKILIMISSLSDASFD